MSDTTADAAVAAEATTVSDIRIVGGNPSAEEIAATTAVLSAVLEELAAEHGRVNVPRQSAWALSQRPFRQAQHPSNRGWRGFTA